MACRIVYLWNDCGTSSLSVARPNRVKVECLGVAVKAKWLMFLGLTLDCWIFANNSSTVKFAISSADSIAKVACNLDAVEPVCELWASSMIMAYFWLDNDLVVKIASITNGKVWIVTTIIGLFSNKASFNCWLLDLPLFSLSSRLMVAIKPF